MSVVNECEMNKNDKILVDEWLQQLEVYNHLYWAAGRTDIPSQEESGFEGHTEE